MSKASASYLIKKAFDLSINNIWRNKFLSLVTIFVIGIIIFIFNVILAINYIAKDSINEIGQKIDLIVYLKEGTSLVQAQDIMNDLAGQEGVIDIKYTSKEEALTELKQNIPGASLGFEKYGLDNPLPASISVRTVDPSYHGKISQYLSEGQYRNYFSGSTGSSANRDIMSSVSHNLVKLSDFTNQVIFWLIMIFVIGGALITLNAFQITIFSRRQEIQIMKLVGSSFWFIRLPFILEGIFFSITAIIISFLMLFFLSQTIELSTVGLFHLNNPRLYLIFLLELAITTGLIIFSSMIAVQEHILKKVYE